MFSCEPDKRQNFFLNGCHPILDDEIYHLYSGVHISWAPVKKLSRDVSKHTHSQQVTHAHLKQAVQKPPRDEQRPG